MVEDNKDRDNRRGDQGHDRTEGQGVEGDVGLEFFQEKESNGDDG